MEVLHEVDGVDTLFLIWERPENQIKSIVEEKVVLRNAFFDAESI